VGHELIEPVSDSRVLSGKEFSLTLHFSVHFTPRTMIHFEFGSHTVLLYRRREAENFIPLLSDMHMARSRDSTFPRL